MLFLFSWLNWWCGQV